MPTGTIDNAVGDDVAYDDVIGRDRHRSRIVPLIASALEGGLSHSDAVRLAISTYKEVDLLARGRNLNQLSAAAIDEIMLYAEAVFRSGSTFSAFEIANRAVSTYELAGKEMNALSAKWRGRTTRQRAIEGIAEGVVAKRRGRPRRQSHGEGL